MGVTDLRFTGHLFTWWDCNIANPVMRKLDHVVVNAEWIANFDLSSAEFLPRGLSDHNPAIVKLWVQRERIFKPFQVFQHILDNTNFLTTVESAWLHPVIGDP